MPEMVKITVLGTCIQQHGPNWQPGVWVNGRCIEPEIPDKVVFLPGEPFEVSLAEAVRLLRSRGGTIVTEPPPPELLEALAAHDETAHPPQIEGQPGPEVKSAKVCEVHHPRGKIASWP